MSDGENLVFVVSVAVTGSVAVVAVVVAATASHRRAVFVVFNSCFRRCRRRFRSNVKGCPSPISPVSSTLLLLVRRRSATLGYHQLQPLEQTSLEAWLPAFRFRDFLLLAACGAKIGSGRRCRACASVSNAYVL